MTKVIEVVKSTVFIKLSLSVIFFAGIIVLNKPHGVTFAQNSNSAGHNITIDTIRPFLLKTLNCQELISAKVPERYYEYCYFLVTTNIFFS